MKNVKKNRQIQQVQQIYSLHLNIFSKSGKEIFLSTISEF